MLLSTDDLRLRKYIEDRSIPIPVTGCWLWLNALSSDGYGVGTISQGGRWLTTGAHRLAYQAYKGEVSRRQAVHQCCDQRWCVNPDHLVLGPDKNTARLNRQRTSLTRGRDRRLWVQSFKEVPCTDCGNRFLPECMDFDHRVASLKIATISQLLSASTARILEEIAKCDVVCANCHRTRTLHRRRDMEAAKKATRLSQIASRTDAQPIIRSAGSVEHEPQKRSCARFETVAEARQAELESNRRWYHRNKAQKLALTKQRRRTNPAFAQMLRDSVSNNRRQSRELIWQLKEAPCADCQGRFPVECMDFDHRDPTTKLFDVSQMPGRRREDILAEAAKCDLVCANCHRTRTRLLKQGVTRSRQ